MTYPSTVFFIVASARSGSTSLARILDTAANGTCAVEPMPNLNRETRLAMDGCLADPMAVVRQTIVPRVQQQEGDVYGEKNVTYGPFIPHLHQALGCRFVFLTRDGRDVVRSLVNWHEQKFGTIYRECRDPGHLSPQALKSAASLPVHQDTSDYARPRPRPGDPLYGAWEHLGRDEMCAYYWSRLNDLYLDRLADLPDDASMRINYTSPTADDVLRVAAFCGLTGLREGVVRKMLDRRINSLSDREAPDGLYPDWKDWDGGRRRRFDRLAAATMQRLGYYTDPATRWRPATYGQWWREHDGGLDWYRWMYNSRRKMHEDFIAWVRARERAGEPIESLADFGCGLGVGYADAFADKRYVGVELSEKNVAWCRENRDNPNHAYLCRDFVAEPFDEPADVVFSSGTVDNTYDMDACLRSMVLSARKWIYATFYRGWFPHLREHRYAWRPEHHCFYNDASPRRLRDTLEALGCEAVCVEPVPTGNTDVPFETRVTARVPAKRT